MVCFGTFGLVFPVADEEMWKEHVVTKIYGLSLENYASLRKVKGDTIEIQFRSPYHSSLFAVLPPLIVTETLIEKMNLEALQITQDMLNALMNRGSTEIGICMPDPAPNFDASELSDLVKAVAPSRLDRGLKINEFTYYVGSQKTQEIYEISVRDGKLFVGDIDGYATFDVDDGLNIETSPSLNEQVKEWRQRNNLSRPVFPPELL